LNTDADFGDSFLVVGDPIGDLPGSQIEADNIATNLFGTTALIGEQATVERVASLLPGAAIAHLATHAYLDPNSPLDSGIVLSDGVLLARDVIGSAIAPHLLTLSACESGLSATLGGEEWAGLMQSFLIAGARTLVVSLWKVDDAVTARFMYSFYLAYLRDGRAVDALYAAMSHVRSHPQWEHPYFWAAFIVVGDLLSLENIVASTPDPS
jgi:CHAT domain-containing protein